MSSQSENLLETVTRNGNSCDACPNLIINGDFSDVCSPAGTTPFIDPGCVGGNWVNAHGSMNVKNGAMEGVVGYSVIDEILEFFNPEAAYSLMNFNSDIEYCLCFSSMYSGQHNTSDINDWKICVYATDNLTSGGPGVENMPSPYTDPNFDTNFEEIYCYDLTNDDIGNWVEHSIPNFSVSESYTQFWPIMLPKESLDLTTETSNYNNHYYFDDINLTCKSEQLIGIGHSEPFPCNFSFFAEEIPNINVEKTTYTWDFGDGNTGTGRNPTHFYDQGGNYTVKLYIIDENGCCQQKTIEVKCDPMLMDYCKYICHEDYLTVLVNDDPTTQGIIETDPFTCAVGVLFNDHNPNTAPVRELYFTQAYSHTDFAGIANEIETELNNIGFNMIVDNYDPTGNVTCYKSICLGCDGTAIPPQFETEMGVPTGVVSGTWTGTTTLMTGNGIPLGTIFTNAANVDIIGTSVPVTYTITISNNIDPNTVVVTQNPNGPGFILQYEETEGLFAMGDVEILTVLGTSDFNDVYDNFGNWVTQECGTFQSGQPTKPFNFCP